MENSATTLHITVRSEPLAVRDALRQLFAAAPLCHLSADGRGTAEIVLAEALNNIVEHAYASDVGSIEVRLRHQTPDLWCEIADVGLPMPDGTLPAGVLHSLNPGDTLPEGGFGWFLIRTLAHDLAYCRSQDRNLLRFRLHVA